MKLRFITPASPAHPAPAAPGAAEEAERWQVRQAREVLAVANRPGADPSARSGYAGVLASCMPGVLEELDATRAQLDDARAVAESAFQDAVAAREAHAAEVAALRAEMEAIKQMLGSNVEARKQAIQILMQLPITP